MCNPISIIITEDKVFLPPDDYWNHSHSFIMKTHNIPDGLIGDKYLRLEVSPPEYNVFRNKKTNEKLEVDDTWEIFVDEKNIPDWYLNDKPNQEDRARIAAKKWFQKFPDNLLDGYRKIAGENAKIIAGHHSTLTGGHHSTLTGRNYSILTGGHHSTLTGGYGSILTGGYNSALTGEYGSILTGGYGSKLTAGFSSTLTAGSNSILTAEHNSTFCAGEKSIFVLIWYDQIKDRMRNTVAYVGENGIEPNKKYYGINSKFEEVKE